MKKTNPNSKQVYSTSPGNSITDSNNSSLPHVSLAVNCYSASRSADTLRQSGFAGNFMKQSVFGTLRKISSVLILSITIFLSLSFTLESGNETSSNNGIMSISPTPDWSVNFGYSFGSASAPAGDVNGDGYADVIVGKKENDSNFTNNGKAYVFLGSASGLSTSPVWTDIGANDGSAYGHTLATAGDVNGDGYDEIIIGEPGYKVGSDSKGRALVYYGSASGPSVAPSWTVIGTTTDLGRCVSTAGDVNGDGYDDVLITTAYGGLDSIPTRGAAFVYYGSASGLSSTPNWKVGGSNGFGLFGISASTAGDVNNDGYADVIVGQTNISSGAGMAYVYLGSASGLSTTAVWTATGEAANHRFGHAVHNAGDVNSDGYDDIIIGAPDDNAGGPGKVYVYYGTSSGVSSTPAWSAAGTADSDFGFSASTVGDYNGDGFSDIIIGATHYSSNGNAFVYKGSSTGLSASPVWTVAGDGTITVLGFQTGSAGDVNNDGYDDVLITGYTPKAYVFNGSVDSGNVVVSGALSPNGTYQTLADAFAVINATQQTGANISISIIGNTTEPITGAKLNGNSWNSLIITPAGNRTISDSTLSYYPLIDLDGADNVTINGLNSGGNSLTISNRSIAYKACTIRFLNDATGNRIVNCTILGASDMNLTGHYYGTVMFDNTGLSNGNDNNSVSNCNIGPASNNLPSNAVFFQGSTGNETQFNSNDSILNCNIYDYFNSDQYSNGSTGVFAGTGNTGLVISGNRFYQTSPRTSSNNTLYQRAIHIFNTDGINFTITNNIIGYSSSDETGIYTIAQGNRPNYFRAIDLTVGTNSPSNVQGNIIKAINITGNNFSTELFKGICVNAGSVNIGNQSPNIIGDSVLTTSINLTGFGTGYAYGIFLSGSGNCITNNNKVFGLLLGTGTAPGRLYGIASSVSGTWECKNNMIGSSAANSISSTFTNIDSKNTGIENTGGSSEISGNLIRNITTYGGGIYSTNGGSTFGMSVNASGNQTISRNVIHSIANLNSDTLGNGGASFVGGLYFYSSGTNVIEKNLIHSIKGRSHISAIRGIRIDGGTNEIRNNMIRIGIDAAGNGINNPCEMEAIADLGGTNNFYFNSVYIGGNPYSGSNQSTWCVYTPNSSTRVYTNNILFNGRSNNGSLGINATFRTNSVPGFTSNYNVLYASGTGGIIGYTLGQQITMANWRSATGQDMQSQNANPQFINPGGNSSTVNLHISKALPIPAERNGTSLSVTEDFDNELRSSFTPHDIGADAGNFIHYDINPMNISYSLLPPANSLQSASLTNVTITDADGVNGTAGTRPRVYFKRKLDSNSFVDNTNSTPGWKYSEAPGAVSPFSFTINFSLLNGAVTQNDTIQYFVIAQDNASIVHAGANAATFSEYPTGVNLTSSAFPVTGTVNSFTFLPMVISVSGAITGNGSYANLTAAFSQINSGAQSLADIVIQILGNTTETSSAILNAGSWKSLVISPAGGAARTITGNLNGSALINLNGAGKVTIDGLNSGGNSLTISNTSTSNLSGTNTIRLQGDAQNNVITNCTVLGSTTTSYISNGGVICIAASSGTGNSFNLISYCDIGPAGSNLPLAGVCSFTGGPPNKNDTIRNCNIYDYYSSSSAHMGVYLGAGSSDFVVKDNKFYQTALRSGIVGQHSAIFIDNTSGSNFSITGNTFGYSSSSGTGTYSLSGSSSGSFVAIYLRVGTTPPTSVQGNTMSSISVTGSMGSSFPVLSFVNLNTGSADIGTVAGNTIGSMNSTGNISYTSTTTSTSNIFLIYNSGTAGWNVRNNSIGGITGSASAAACNIIGINSNSTSQWTCSANTIGGNVGNSIVTTSTVGTPYVQGVTSSAGVSEINGNTIRNLTSAAGSGFTNTTSTGGIICWNSGANKILGNVIYGLNNTSLSNACYVTGIYCGTSGPNSVSSNLIHTLTASSPNATVSGTVSAFGVTTFQNNIIRLGLDSSGNSLNTGYNLNGMMESGGTNNYYFNSIYIGGNATSGSAFTYGFNSSVVTVTRNFKNNIFYNARTSTITAVRNYAIRVAGTGVNPAGLSCNYNILFAPNSGGCTGYYNGDQNNLAAWRIATGKDSNSFASDPKFINPTGSASNFDLHISNSSTPVEQTGTPIAGITDDFDKELRSNLTPTDIGADAGNFTMQSSPLNGDYTVGLAMFNSVAGTNVYFEKVTKKVMTEVEEGTGELDGSGNEIKRTVSKEVDEEKFVPMQNGKVYNGPLFVKRESNTGLPADAMLGVYASINTALNDLYSVGASGPVRFMLLDANYNSETLPLFITAYSGESSVNTLTIKPAPGVTSTISGNNGTAVIDINNINYFTLDGSNSNGGTTKDLTVSNASTSAPVIRIANDANNNTVKNSILKGATTSNSNGVVFFTTTNKPTGNDSNLVQNNDITKNGTSPAFCVYNNGTGTSSATKNTRNKITGNRCFDFSSRGIVDEGNSAGNLYEGNEIYSVVGQSNFQVGIRIVGTTIEGFTIRNNYIHDLKTSAATLIYGIEVNSLQSGFTGEIYNNFISLSEINSTDIKGINETSASNVNIRTYYNSINVYGTVSGAKSSECYYRQSGSNTIFKNNILVNTRSGGTGRHYAIRTNTPFNTLVSNYNDIYAGGGTANVFGRADLTEVADLTAWRAATAADSNSVSANPLFVSNTNLHIDSTAVSPASNAGTPIAGITNDFDYNTRNISTPDIGADEYNYVIPVINLNLTMLIEGFYNPASNLQVADSVKVQLRNSSSPYGAVDSAVAIVNDSGKASLIFPNAATGNYYLRLQHRNALETWSAGIIAKTTGGTTLYDFTTAASQAFGDNMKQVDSSPTKFAIFSGDVNKDETIDLTDIVNIFNDANAFVSGYVVTDLTGDDFVDLSDLTIAFNNSNAFVSVIKP